MNTSQDSIASANGKGANMASKPGATGGQVATMAGKKRKQRPNGSTSEKSLDDDGVDPGQPMLQKMFNEKMMIGKFLKPDFTFLANLILLYIGGIVGINSTDQTLMK